MKIGLITIHYSQNYGASLQSFALYKYLEQAGYDVEIIDLHRPSYADYVPSKHFHQYKHRHQTYKQRIKSYIHCCLNLFRKLFHTNHNTESTYKESEDDNALPPKFKEFNAQIRLSRAYRGIDDLYKDPPQYDVYLTGSDQVWNPSQNYCIEPYFLTFVKKGRRISYASSLGIEDLTRREQHDFCRWLRRYDIISVRERQAQELLQKITGKDIEQVADPTFLLDIEYWQNISIYPEKRGYILLFTLAFAQHLADYAIRLSQEKGKKLIILNQNQPLSDGQPYTAVTNAGPTEFLGYISHADMVITDSFHCTLFSILMGARNFHTYIAPWNQRGSRIIDLLNTFKLEDHLLHTDLKQTYEDLEAHTIDRKVITDIHLREQSHSRQFLADNL